MMYKLARWYVLEKLSGQICGMFFGVIDPLWAELQLLAQALRQPAK